MKTYQGKLIGKGKKFTLVVSRFNDFIGKRLVEGAVDVLVRHGVEENGIEVIWVPGSLEILYVANKMAKKKKCDAVICLGAIIKGETSHFDFLASQVIKGISQISLSGNLPVVSGIITVDSLEQAIQRAGAKEGNKGTQAALAALEMANLNETAI
ncbi:MAG: 6,7-dimethyl-8-ribityllumazine synthase [Candidatus Omnitrophica bacterium 4484_213]|nr:MAG: 6,7-dimethyl-8-ribityllumazine synthase [Candidatus Omnitrophica bacterium 4484_213]